MKKLKGKVALVTGGGGGIGRGICKMLASAGAQVVVTGRNLNNIEETAKIITEAGGDASAITLDVTHEDDWQKVIDHTLHHYKKLNILVSNAGIQMDENGCEDVTLENWRNILGINLDGVFLGIRAAIIAMKNNSDENSIINISSTGALMPHRSVSYCVSKAGVGMLSKCAALECRKKGYDNIRVNTILPGVIKDGMGHQVKELDAYQEIFLNNCPPARLGEEQDIAKAVLFLASDDSSYMTGSELVVDGGLSVSASSYMLNSFAEQVHAWRDSAQE